jgi:hypothetical protein
VGRLPSGERGKTHVPQMMQDQALRRQQLRSTNLCCICSSLQCEGRYLLVLAGAVVL